jgi:hypothetical protein
MREMTRKSQGTRTRIQGRNMTSIDLCRVCNIAMMYNKKPHTSIQVDKTPNPASPYFLLQERTTRQPERLTIWYRLGRTRKAARNRKSREGQADKNRQAFLPSLRRSFFFARLSAVRHPSQGNQKGSTWLASLKSSRLMQSPSPHSHGQYLCFFISLSAPPPVALLTETAPGDPRIR